MDDDAKVGVRKLHPHTSQYPHSALIRCRVLLVQKLIRCLLPQLDDTVQGVVEVLLAAV